MASRDSNSALQSSDSFTHPWEYEFPPFFTIQPNLETRKMQLEAWRSLILDYCQHKKVQQLNLRDLHNKPPFCNPSIDRRLSLEAMQVIIASMVEKKFAEWIDREREKCLVYSRPLEQWAQIILEYVREKSLHNTIMTFYELLEGESTEGREFHGLDETIFFKALKLLERTGKATVIEMDGNKGQQASHRDLELLVQTCIWPT